MAPTPMTPTRIADATEPRMSRRNINARRVPSRAKPSYHPEASAAPRVRDLGGRSRLREAGEPPHGVLDDLVQGHPVLLLLGAVPTRFRPEAGTLPPAHARPPAEGSRLLTACAGEVTRSSGGLPRAASARRGLRGSRSRGRIRTTRALPGVGAGPRGSRTAPAPRRTRGRDCTTARPPG